MKKKEFLMRDFFRFDKCILCRLYKSINVLLEETKRVLILMCCQISRTLLSKSRVSIVQIYLWLMKNEDTDGFYLFVNVPKLN